MQVPPTFLHASYVPVGNPGQRSNLSVNSYATPPPLKNLSVPHWVGSSYMMQCEVLPSPGFLLFYLLHV